MPPIRILLVDDLPLVREGIASLLTAHGYQVVDEAGDGVEALAKARELRPDLILMDVLMPRCCGIQATRLIKAEMPYIKIVMLTICDDDHTIFEAIRSGASGYLLKSLTSADFFDLLGGISRDEAPVPRRLATRILEEFARQGRKDPTEEMPGHDLTGREREILRLLAQGAPNKDIAANLSLTENTVKYHMKHILEKLHLRNRAQVVAYALQTGMVMEGRAVVERSRAIEISFPSCSSCRW